MTFRVFLFFLFFLLVAGVHSALAQTQRMVLVEQRTSSSCPNCGNQNPGFDALVQANSDRVALLKYQWGDPGHPDIMYDFNPTDVNRRVLDFYNTPGFPWVIEDGTDIGPAGSYSQAHIDAAAAEPAWMEITGLASITPTRDQLNVAVTTTALGNINSLHDTALTLYVAVVERTIDFGAPPGTNTESVFLSVMRKLLPHADGTVIGAQTQGEIQEHTFAYPVDTTVISIDSLQIVAFVQNRHDKTVEQAAVIVPGQEAVGVHEASGMNEQLRVWPVPASDYVRVSGRVVDVLDARGRSLAANALIESSNEQQTQLNVSALQTGHYFVRDASGRYGRFAVVR